MFSLLYKCKQTRRYECYVVGFVKESYLRAEVIFLVSTVVCNRSTYQPLSRVCVPMLMQAVTLPYQHSNCGVNTTHLPVYISCFASKINILLCILSVLLLIRLRKLKIRFPSERFTNLLAVML